MKRKNRRKIFIILLAIIILLTLLIFILFRLEKPGNKEIVKNKNKNNSEEEKWTTPTGTLGKIYIYSNGDEVKAVNETKENNIVQDTNFKVIASYDCALTDCKAYGAYKNKNYIIIKDDNYYIYNYKKNKAMRLNFPDALYNTISFLGYENKVYGLSVSNINDLYSYYSIEDEKFITEFKYSMINTYENASFANNRFIASIYNGTEEKYYVVDTKTGKQLWESNEPISSFGNEKYIYYAKEFGEPLTSSVQIYNDEYKLVNDKKYTLYGVSKDGNLALINDNNTFSLYNKNGSLIKTSKSYKRVGNIFNDYVAVVDNDEYLKLIDYDGNVVARFIKLQEKYYFYPELSYMKYEKKENTIYLCVENLNIKYGNEGNGLLYYYNLNTKQKGIIELKSAY